MPYDVDPSYKIEEGNSNYKYYPNIKKDNATKLNTILEKNPAYRKMLNNLLGISNRSNNAIFVKGQKDNFDLKEILSDEDYHKVFHSPEFKVELTTKQEMKIISQLEAQENQEDFLQIIDKNDFYVSNVNRSLLSLEFAETKTKIIQDLKKKATRDIVKWKQFQKKYLDYKLEKNSWPLYIGTMMIKLCAGNKKFYAPLLFKQVEIEITKTNKVFLKTTNNSLFLNEKLIFLLKDEYKFNTPSVSHDKDYSFLEGKELLANNLKKFVCNELKLGKFDFLKKIDITNERMEYAPGIILSLVNPQGLKLREKFIDLTLNDQLEELLLVEDLLENRSANIHQALLQGRGIYRINPTDISQEKAIIASLKGHTIIWGPPGTGKSQVITNIIANILSQNKSAIITSEKKQALNVIQRRMGKLAKFMFFGLTDLNDSKKEDFYKPFQELLATIQEVNNSGLNNTMFQQPASYITSSHKNFFSLKEDMKNEDINSLWSLSSKLSDSEILELKEFKEKHLSNIINELKEINIMPKNTDNLEENKWLNLRNALNSSQLNLMINIKKKLNNNAIMTLVNNKNIFLPDIAQELKHEETFTETLKKLGIKKERSFIWKAYPKEIKDFQGMFHSFGADVNLFNNIAKLDDINNLPKLSKYKEIEYFCEQYNSHMNNDMFEKLNKIHDFANIQNWDRNLMIENAYRNNNSTFCSDENYLEHLLAKQFLTKINSLKQTELNLTVNKFISAINSAWQKPYKFIHKYKNVIEQIFDVFVSTPNELASIISLEKCKSKQFDYAIFDEASQLHPEKAIPFISIAKTSILAGDDQQMRPSAWMQKRDNSDNESEFDAQSLLDFGTRQGLTNDRTFMLTKNYRSNNAELMLFSAKQFYQGELDAIDNKHFIDNEAIIVHEIDGVWDKTINEKEANLALEILKQEHKNFQSIILLTLNSKQKMYIENLIYNEKAYSWIIDLINSNKLTLRNLENIQGDEAELVIISVAYDKSAKLGSTYVARPEGKNALNVAITRAIKKQIIIKSIQADEVSTDGKNKSIYIFKQWLEYLESSKDAKNKYLLAQEINTLSFDSDFEKNVYNALVQKFHNLENISIKTQYPVGSYRIDIGIVNSLTNEFLLGIEVDGYKYHSGHQKHLQDIERQKYLEAKGYLIYRILELNWTNHQDHELGNIHKLIS